MNDFNYDIKENFGTISEKNDGKFTLELNLISYRGKEEKYDLRRWDRSCDKMLKGLTMDKNEILELKNILNNISFE